MYKINSTRTSASSQRTRVPLVLAQLLLQICMEKWRKLTRWRELGRARTREISDHSFLESRGYLEQWMPQTATDIEDIRFEFRGKQRTQRIVEERQLSQPSIWDDKNFALGRLYFHHHFTKLPSILRKKATICSSNCIKKAIWKSFYHNQCESSLGRAQVECDRCIFFIKTRSSGTGQGFSIHSI